MSKRALYIKDNAGHLRQWSCYEVVGGLEIEHGVVNGTMQYQFEEVEANSVRDQDEQIESRINSRYNKQLDKGYTYDMTKAANSKPMNALGYHKPMLAKKEEDAQLDQLLKHTVYCQYKLDGNRCLIHNDGVKLTAYTRNGKMFTTLDHILKELEGKIPEGCTVDGELYIHGMPLQSFVSLVKRKQKRTEEVNYYIYDMISDEGFGYRSEVLESILSDFKDNPKSSIKLVKTLKLEPENSNKEVLKRLLNEARRLKYEGLMLRSDYTVVRGVLKAVGYEDGKRSGSLIKFKAWDDEEFEIIDIQPSKDGWAILTCRNYRGKNFTVSCPGDVNHKRMVLNQKEMFIGKYVTVQFAYWTEELVPFHPTATAIRDYE